MRNQTVLQVKIIEIYNKYILDASKSNEKFINYIKYIQNTWIPLYEDGMIKYSRMDNSEWTNNAIENYHKLLQNKLTK